MILENALFGVFVLATAISIVIALLYKFTMDHEEIGKIKDKMDELKEKSEAAKEGGEMDKANEHMQEMMKHSSKQMKMQIKPMALTFVIIIPLLWFVFPNLYPNAVVDLNQTDTLTYKNIETPVSVESTDPLKVSVDEKSYKKGDFFSINDYRFHVENYKEDKQSIKFERVAAKLPFSVPFIGNSLGWLGWYILIAIGLGQVFRKLLGAMP